MSVPTVFSLTGLRRRSGASDSDIEAAERALGALLPGDYRAFLQESDGLEGSSGPEGDYMMLWAAGEIAK
ncbi:MAG TPA: SMI1/KNR4 family protein, partial [Planctomycetota bacterium]|nr:SMI1/KNR4 family protein [Planctomycetota bacterium]